MKRVDIERLITFLTNGRHHPPLLTETHISWVILTNRYAYKIKKPVKFSFLDFSTLNRRKHYCEQEIALNKRLTSGMYLGIIPIFRHRNGIDTEGPGTVIDYAVLMNRLDRTLEMDKLLEGDKVKPQAIRSLAQKIAMFHQGAQIVPGKFSVESLQKQFDDISSVSNPARQYIGQTGPLLIKRIIAQSTKFLQCHHNLFSERSRSGFIRDIHGDLHSGNIFLYEDPVIFDCIEFNDAFRQIDILDEVAFLAMDIESYGRNDLSDLFYRSYVESMKLVSSEANQLLYAYYKFYRAGIRAKTALLKASQPGTDVDVAIKDATRYFDLLKIYSGKWQN